MSYIVKSAYGAMGNKVFDSYERAEKEAKDILKSAVHAPHVDICEVKPVKRIKQLFEIEDL